MNLQRFITDDASAVITVLDGCKILEKIKEYHKPSAVVCAALGRLSVACSLMGYNLKGDDESITLQINADGLTGTILAVSDSRGNVKCYADNYEVYLPLNPLGKLDVSGAVGKNGTLSVVKDLKLKQPYVSQVPLVSGEIAEDIAFYYANSEQTPTVCSLGVLLLNDEIIAAGGFLLNLLPFAPEEVISTIEENIVKIPSVTDMLKNGFTAANIAEKVLENLNPTLMDSAEVSYICNCSRHRTEEILIALGKQELEKLAAEQEITEVACHFCDKIYQFTAEELLSLVN